MFGVFSAALGVQWFELGLLQVKLHVLYKWFFFVRLSDLTVGNRWFQLVCVAMHSTYFTQICRSCS